MRSPFLLLLIGVLTLAPMPPLAAEERGTDEARIGATRAADALLTAWRTPDPVGVTKAAQGEAPDRFRVVLAVALRARDDAERREVLTAFAKARGGADDAALRRAAERYAAATPAELEDERVRLELARTVERSVMTGAKTVDAALADLDAVDPAPAWSIAGVVVQWMRLRLMLAQRRVGTREELAASLLALADERQWHQLTLDVHMKLARLRHAEKNRRAAVQEYGKAARAARILDLPAAERTALQYAVVLSMNTGDLVERYGFQTRLAALMNEHAPERVRLRMQLWLIDAEIRLRALTSAYTRCETLLAKARETQDRGLALNTLTQMMRIRIAQGRFPEALDLEGDLHVHRDLSDDPNDRSRAASALCALYREVGRHAEALELCERSLEEAPAGGKLIATSTGPMLALKAALLEDLGRHADARLAWRRAMELYREYSQTPRLVSSLCALARYEVRRGGFEDATALAEEAIREAATAAPRVQITAYRTASKVAHIRGQGERALALADQALDLAARGEPAPGEVAHLLAARGRALQLLSRHADAADALERATRLMLDVASGVGERHGLDLRARAHDIARAGFASCVTLPKSEARAWWFREASHALLLAQSIRGGGDLRERVSAEDRATLQAALRRLTKAHTEAIAAERTGAPAGARTEAREALQALHDQYAEIVAHVEHGARGDGASAVARPVALEAFQKALPAKTLAVAYVQAAGRMHALVLTREGAALHDLGDSRRIAEGVEAWRDLASTPEGPSDKVGARLYDTLLRPFEATLAQADALVVLPDGALASLPFSALVTARDATGRASGYVLDRVAVRYVASAAVDGALRARGEARGRGACCFGDPTYDETFAHLPGSGQEVGVICGLYPDEATRSFTRAKASLASWAAAVGSSEGPPWRALHVACHGAIDADRPYLSGLVLAGGEILTVEHVTRHPIRADLVVLSACDTAMGRHRSGEGVLGLTRGFLQAGAPRVVVSTWAVSDATTVELMASLHRAWSGGGTDAAGALRRARLALRQQGGKYAHPYYWAPFVLWGAQ